MTESDLMRAVMIALSAEGHVCFRANIGLFYTKDGRPVSTGLPKGFSDLFGMTKCGRFFALEVKTKTGKIRPEQAQFISAMEKRGGIAFIARSTEQALHEMQQRIAAFDVQHSAKRPA